MPSPPAAPGSARLVVVTNPRSRRNRRDPGLRERLRALVGDAGVVEAPGSREELAALATRLAADPPAVLALHGGDGTSHSVLTALWRAGLRELPPVLLLPAGTMNTIASGLGLRGRDLAVLRRALPRLAEPASLPHTARSLLVADGGDGPQLGFLFGNGVISNYLHAYYEGSEPTPAKALWVLARGVLSSFVNGAAFRRLVAPAEVRVEVDGGTWAPERYVAVGAGTVDDIGFRFRPFFRAPSAPGRIHLLGIACPPFSFVLELPRIWLAKPTRHPDIHTALTPGFTLRSAGPIDFMVDGDFHRGGREVVVTAGPTVRFLLP